MPDIREVIYRARSLREQYTVSQAGRDILALCDFTEAAVGVLTDTLTSDYGCVLTHEEHIFELLGLDAEKFEREFSRASEENDRPMDLSRCRKELPCQTST